jgi:hypothetical protein
MTYAMIDAWHFVMVMAGCFASADNDIGAFMVPLAYC